ncbi:MAG: peptidoglycan DD-metalloendopeptidase family protein [Pseudomonadota bacterium]
MYDMKVGSREYIPAPRKEDRDAALKKACKEFESVLTYELLKSMRRTIDKSDLFHGGQGEEIYQSMLDQELAKTMSRGENNSLAAILYEQLKRRESAGGTEQADPGEALKDPRDARPLWPLKTKVSSGFGWRKDPIDGLSRFHHGIDLPAREGALVRASMPGKVLKSETREGYGNIVILEHEQGFTSLYAHNRKNLVKEGDWVDGGTPLARVGSSGRSTGPHLHFEVRRNGEHLDPREFLGLDPV